MLHEFISQCGQCTLTRVRPRKNLTLGKAKFWNWHQTVSNMPKAGGKVRLCSKLVTYHIDNLAPGFNAQGRKGIFPTNYVSVKRWSVGVERRSLTPSSRLNLFERSFELKLYGLDSYCYAQGLVLVVSKHEVKTKWIFPIVTDLELRWPHASRNLHNSLSTLELV